MAHKIDQSQHAYYLEDVHVINLVISLTAGGKSAAAAPTWIASYGFPGSYPFRPSPAENHGQHKIKLSLNLREWAS